MAKHFTETMVEISPKIEKILEINITITLTSQEEKEHNSCNSDILQCCVPGLKPAVIVFKC